jgi:hypothetical protein
MIRLGLTAAASTVALLVARRPRRDPPLDAARGPRSGHAHARLPTRHGLVVCCEDDSAFSPIPPQRIML